MITLPYNTTFHLCASFFRGTQSALYIIVYFSLIISLRFLGWLLLYHFTAGKGDVAEVKPSVQVPSLAMVSILELLQEASSYLKIKSPGR